MPVAHNVVQYQGSMPGGEVWSVGTKFGADQGDLYTTFEDLLLWGQNIVEMNGGEVVPTAMLQMFGTGVTLERVRLEHRDATHELTAVAEVSPANPVYGTSSSIHPHQVSLVTSLLTGRPGRSYRGRIYWPATGQVLDQGSLRVPSSELLALNLAVEGFLSSAEEAQPTERAVTLSVVSDTLSATTPVTMISMGDVPDIQRRRRDRLTENRTFDDYSGRI